MSRSEEARVEVRSFRNVFALERRIYRVEGIRLNPGGVPIRGVLYFMALLAALLVLAALPVSGWVLALLPWYARDVVLPAGVAAMLALVRVEGRTCHLAGYALVRHALASRRLCGLRSAGVHGPGRRWHPPELLLLVDGSDPVLRRLRFTGPGAVLLTVPHICLEPGGVSGAGRSRLRVHALSSSRAHARPRVLDLAPHARVHIERA
jgi:hypothetical protein